MRNRKKTLERLLEVKTRLKAIEEARLAGLERQRAEAEEERRAMLSFLDGACEKDSLMLGLACRRVVAAERGAAALEAQAVRQREVLVRRNAQRRALENLLKEATRAVDRDDEKRRLFDIGERLASQGPTDGARSEAVAPSRKPGASEAP